MADGMKKNLDEVKEGLLNMQDEWADQTRKVKIALAERDPIRVLHHLTGYRQAAQEHAHKLWFYTFWPKWVAVALLIWYY